MFSIILSSIFKMYVTGLVFLQYYLYSSFLLPPESVVIQSYAVYESSFHHILAYLISKQDNPSAQFGMNNCIPLFSILLGCFH